MQDLYGLAITAAQVTAGLLLIGLVLIGVAAYRRRSHDRKHAPVAHAAGPRIGVVESTIVDDRRQLLLIRRDNIEHLVMIGGPTDLVVEGNIGAARAVPAEAGQATRPAAAAVKPATGVQQGAPIAVPPAAMPAARPEAEKPRAKPQAPAPMRALDANTPAAPHVSDQVMPAKQGGKMRPALAAVQSALSGSLGTAASASAGGQAAAAASPGAKPVAQEHGRIPAGGGRQEPASSAPAASSTAATTATTATTATAPREAPPLQAEPPPAAPATPAPATPAPSRPAPSMPRVGEPLRAELPGTEPPRKEPGQVGIPSTSRWAGAGQAVHPVVGPPAAGPDKGPAAREGTAPPKPAARTEGADKAPPRPAPQAEDADNIEGEIVRALRISPFPPLPFPANEPTHRPAAAATASAAGTPRDVGLKTGGSATANPGTTLGDLAEKLEEALAREVRSASQGRNRFNLDLDTLNFDTDRIRPAASGVEAKSPAAAANGPGQATAGAPAPAREPASQAPAHAPLNAPGPTAPAADGRREGRAAIDRPGEPPVISLSARRKEVSDPLEDEMARLLGELTGDSTRR